MASSSLFGEVEVRSDLYLSDQARVRIIFVFLLTILPNSVRNLLENHGKPLGALPLDASPIQIQRRISVISLLEVEPAEGTQEKDEAGISVEAESNAIAERKATRKDH